MKKIVDIISVVLLHSLTYWLNLFLLRSCSSYKFVNEQSKILSVIDIFSLIYKLKTVFQVLLLASCKEIKKMESSFIIKEEFCNEEEIKIEIKDEPLDEVSNSSEHSNCSFKEDSLLDLDAKEERVS